MYLKKSVTPSGIKQWMKQLRYRVPPTLCVQNCMSGALCWGNGCVWPLQWLVVVTEWRHYGKSWWSRVEARFLRLRSKFRVSSDKYNVMLSIYPEYRLFYWLIVIQCNVGLRQKIFQESRHCNQSAWPWSS